MSTSPTDELREHLVASRLAGEVNTSPGHVLANCRKLVHGDPNYTFGLSDWHDASLDEVHEAVVALCGKEVIADPEAESGWIDPDRCLEGIATHRETLARIARSGARVLLATGHPTGLLMHYATIARVLREAGCEILQPLDDHRLGTQEERVTRVRFVGGVACAATGADLLHTHRPDIMELLLEALAARDGLPDLVLGDHGLAGAAIEAGLDTLSIADNNDPALPLAQARGRTGAVLTIDDSLAPRLFEPVTKAMLSGLP
ncbi:MAG: phosphatase [Nitriliruptorales bacterium]